MGKFISERAFLSHASTIFTSYCFNFETVICNYTNCSNEPSVLSYEQFLLLIVSGASVLANCEAIVAFCSFIAHRLCDQVISEAAKAWRNYVKEQLYKGGGKLFKYIAKEDKAFANVHLVDDTKRLRPKQSI